MSKRWALTEEDALNMNLHLCSHAPAFPVTVKKSEFMRIWNDPNGSYVWSNPWNGVDVRILDERHLSDIDDSDDDWDIALCVAGAGLTNTPTTTAAPAAANNSQTPAALALTGRSSTSRATAGAALMAAGGALVALGKRREAVQESAL